MERVVENKSAVYISQSKEYFAGIDILKFIAALMVVAIHTSVLDDCFRNNEFALILSGVFTNLAVPLFFIASGFLCFSRADGDPKNEISRTRKAAASGLWLYVAWTLIYLPASIAMFVLEGRLDWTALPRYVHKVIFVGEWQLWFLLSMTIGYFIIALLLSHGFSKKFVLGAGLVAFIVECFIELIQNASYSCASPPVEKIVSLYDVIFASPRVIFQGLFYISIGMFIADNYKSVIFRIRGKYSRISAGIVACIAVVGLSVVVSQSVNLFVSVIIGSICRVILASMIFALTTLFVRQTALPFACSLRSMSAVFYLVHMYFILIFVYAICGGRDTSLLNNQFSYVEAFIFSVIGCLIVSTAVIPLSAKNKFVARLFNC